LSAPSGGCPRNSGACASKIRPRRERGDPLEQRLDLGRVETVMVGHPRNGRVGNEPSQRRTEPRLVQWITRMSQCHNGIGEINLPDRELRDGPVVIGGGGQTALGERLVACRVGEPGLGIQTGQYGLDAHVATGGSVDPADHSGDDDILDRPTDRLGLERRIQCEHNAIHRIAGGERAQQGQQIHAQRARDTAVCEFQQGRCLVVADAHRPMHDPLTQPAQVVPNGDRARRRAQRLGRTVHARWGASGESGDHHDGRSVGLGHSNPFR
jgi:hypothetical protein